MARRYYGKRYRSNNALVDWIFWRFIDILNNKIHSIVFRTPLKDPDNPRRRIFGMWMKNDHIINYRKEKILFEARVLYIDPEWHQMKEEEIPSTLIHELCHILFTDFLTERSVARIETILCKELSSAQKGALARFLPKKIETQNGY